MQFLMYFQKSISVQQYVYLKSITYIVVWKEPYSASSTYLKQKEIIWSLSELQ